MQILTKTPGVVKKCAIIFKMLNQKEFENFQVAKLLRKVSAAYELLGENSFRIKAYDTASESIEHASREVKDIWQDGKLEELPGIGSAIASHLQELFTTGKVSHFEQVFKKLPPAVFELIEIPGLGPKRALKLVHALKLKSANQAVIKLQQAAQQGKISLIRGFGKDSELAISKGIEAYRKMGNRMLLPTALALAEEVVTFLQKCPVASRVDPLGSLRRRSPTIGDLDIAIASEKPKEVISYLKTAPFIFRTLAVGEKSLNLLHKNGKQIDIKIEGIILVLCG